MEYESWWNHDPQHCLKTFTWLDILVRHTYRNCVWLLSSFTGGTCQWRCWRWEVWQTPNETKGTAMQESSGHCFVLEYGDVWKLVKGKSYKGEVSCLVKLGVIGLFRRCICNPTVCMLDSLQINSISWKSNAFDSWVQTPTQVLMNYSDVVQEWINSLVLYFPLKFC